MSTIIPGAATYSTPYSGFGGYGGFTGGYGAPVSYGAPSYGAPSYGGYGGVTYGARYPAAAAEPAEA